MKQYIEQVLRDNLLGDEIKCFKASPQDCWFVDRHVDVPGDLFSGRPTTEQIEAACAAGMRLLAQWEKDRHLVQMAGYFASHPVLVIDDAWLAQESDAPPPHVCIVLAKNPEEPALRDTYPPGDEHYPFPLKKLLDEHLGDFFKSVRLLPQPELGEAGVGFWLVKRRQKLS
jgi:hypothetical protein